MKSYILWILGWAVLVAVYVLLFWLLFIAVAMLIEQGGFMSADSGAPLLEVKEGGSFYSPTYNPQETVDMADMRNMKL